MNRTPLTFTVVAVALLTVTGSAPIGGALGTDATLLPAAEAPAIDTEETTASRLLATASSHLDGDRAQAETAHSQHALGADLLALAEHPSGPGSLLEAAELAIAHRGDLAETQRAPIASSLDRQASHLEAASRLLDEQASAQTGLSQAIEQTRAIAEAQGSGLDLATTSAMSAPAFASPSQALAELAERHDAGLSADQHQAIEDLDELPAPVPGALADLVEAFLALEDATADRQQASSASSGSPTASAQAPDELATLLDTRQAFLDAVVSLESALAGAGSLAHPTNSHGHLDACPAFALDLEGVDSTYTEDCALVIDVGGADVHRNNAGGSNLADGDCQAQGTASALVSLGTEDDVFGDQTDPRSCGANGGGDGGTGILVAEGGDNTYVAASNGTNGGARGQAGVGLLVDAGGNDTYRAGEAGTNGGAAASGVATLLDAGGDDGYDAGEAGTNGGGVTQGAGSLFDLGGIDTYEADSAGTNGGGATQGVGLLFNDGEQAVFEGGGFGTNGGGAGMGVGMLVASGTNAYQGASTGVNGGGGLFGVGFLIDDEAASTYEGLAGGINGGGHLTSVGTLVSLGGGETFTAERGGANGGANAQSAGFLFSGDGDDRYTGGSEGINGGARDTGTGTLIDAGGNDTYQATSFGVNGGGVTDGIGTLLDVEGDDAYTASHAGANGGSALGTGILLDGQGTDRYEDDRVPGGACTDCSVPVKGVLGAQIDADPPPSTDELP